MEFAFCLGARVYVFQGALDVQLRMKKTCPWPCLRPFEIAVCVCVRVLPRKTCWFPFDFPFEEAQQVLFCVPTPARGVVVFCTWSGFSSLGRVAHLQHVGHAPHSGGRWATSFQGGACSMLGLCPRSEANKEEKIMKKYLKEAVKEAGPRRELSP